MDIVHQQCHVCEETLPEHAFAPSQWVLLHIGQGRGRCRRCMAAYGRLYREKAGREKDLARRIPCPEVGCKNLIAPKAKRCRDCHLRRSHGSLHPRWKGNGRHRNSGGYIMAAAHQHPRANKGGYVSEHRLVMEAHIGRYLLPEENVHHINGVRDDNRLENLELWVSSQPKGQRPVDLVTWAKEVIDRYGSFNPTKE